MFEPLSDFIRLRRKQKNLTQEKLAKMAKVSRRQLALLEDGRNVSLLFLMKIADALEITEIPVGPLRVFVAPPELTSLVRSAEAIQNLKQTSDTWKDAAEAIDQSAATIDALIVKVTAPPPSVAAIYATAQRLAKLPTGEGKAAADRLRMLAGTESSGAERPAEAAAGSEDDAIWPR